MNDASTRLMFMIVGCALAMAVLGGVVAALIALLHV